MKLIYEPTFAKCCMPLDYMCLQKKSRVSFSPQTWNISNGWNAKGLPRLPHRPAWWNLKPYSAKSQILGVEAVPFNHFVVRDGIMKESRACKEQRGTVTFIVSKSASNIWYWESWLGFLCWQMFITEPTNVKGHNKWVQCPILNIWNCLDVGTIYWLIRSRHPH